LHLHLDVVEVAGERELDGAFLALSRLHPDAVLVVADPFLPSIYTYGEQVKAGGLISYSPSYYEIFRRAAVFVEKILKGTKPSDLPVEQPTKFELAINLKTAMHGLHKPDYPCLRLTAGSASCGHLIKHWMCCLVPNSGLMRGSRQHAYSITSSARSRNASGMAKPSTLAVVRLMTRSNLVGCSTGMSAGLVPRNILSMYSAPRRNKSS
jgi:hypothetical protein